MKKKTNSKRPSNNFNNSFAQAIFKSNPQYIEDEKIMKSASSQRSSKTTRSSANDLTPGGPGDPILD